MDTGRQLRFVVAPFFFFASLLWGYYLARQKLPNFSSSQLLTDPRVAFFPIGSSYCEMPPERSNIHQQTNRERVLPLIDTIFPSVYSLAAVDLALAVGMSREQPETLGSLIT